MATVSLHGGRFIDEVKRREDCRLWTLTRSNRDTMAQQIVAWLAQSAGPRRGP